MGAQLFCTQCGAAGTVSQKFCATCGQALGGSADPRIGTMLGPFRLDGVIAAGGFGVVYRAHDTKLQRNVALKLLREELAIDDEFRHRFLRESRAAAGLDHQNILPMFDAGEVDGVLYIATRLVDGVDLRRRLAREGLFAVDRALAIVHQIGVALDFAHGKGLVHRDVKPANILLVGGQHGEDEHAYLIDFGITKNVEADRTLTMTGHFVGTPEYVAPEQIENDRMDGRADQYALACVLHHCLTGGPPFVRETTVDLLFAHMHADPPRASAVCTGLPDSVDNAIMRALSKDPARRFETCRAFVSAARAGTGAPTPHRATAAPPEPQSLPPAPTAAPQSPPPAPTAAPQSPPPTAAPQSLPPTAAPQSLPPAPAPAPPSAWTAIPPPAPSSPLPSPAPPTPPSRSSPDGTAQARGPRIAAFVVLAVLLVSGAIVGVLLMTGGSDDPSTDEPSASTPPPPPASAKPEQETARPAATSKRDVVAVLRRYQVAYSSQNVIELRRLFTRGVKRRGLRAGGCSTTSGLDDVLQTYREQFATGTGTYTLRGLSTSAISTDGTQALAKLRYAIDGGAGGSVSFVLKRVSGDWRISNVYASC